MNKGLTSFFKRRAWLLLVIVAALIAAVFVPNAWRTSVYYSMNAAFTRLTSRLPDCDKIEIDAISGEETKVISLDATKTLSGNDTRQFEDLWRNLDVRDGPGDMCHAPIYRFHFYTNDGLYAEATICFHCNNIYFIRENGTAQADELREVGFNADSASSKNLRQYLSSLFPGHDPEAESGK